MLYSRRNSSAKIARIVVSRSSCFLLTGLAAILSGLWSLPVAAQGGHLPPDDSALLLADSNVCWSFQKTRHTAQQLAEQLDRYTADELTKGHTSPVSIDRSSGQPVLAVCVLAYIDYAKPVPCPSQSAVAQPALPHQLNTTVVATVSAPMTFATHFGLGF